MCSFSTYASKNSGLCDKRNGLRKQDTDANRYRYVVLILRRGNVHDAAVARYVQRLCCSV